MPNLTTTTPANQAISEINGCLDKTGGTMTGDLTISKASPTINANGTSSGAGGFIVKENNVNKAWFGYNPADTSNRCFMQNLTTNEYVALLDAGGFIYRVGSSDVFTVDSNGTINLNSAVTAFGADISCNNLNIIEYIKSALTVGFLTQGGSAQGVNMGNLLVSNSYSDRSKVPSNGVYSKGGVVSDGNITIGKASPYIYLDATGTNDAAVIISQEDGADRGYIGYHTGNNYVYMLNASCGDYIAVTDDAHTIIFNGTNTIFDMNNATGSLLLPYVYNATVGSTNRDLCIDNTGKLGYVSSSERYKTDINPLTEYSSKLKDLNPVSFVYKDDDPQTVQFGLIAEEVNQIMPELVSYLTDNDGELVLDDDGQLICETVSYYKLIPLLLDKINVLELKIKALEAKLI